MKKYLLGILSLLLLFVTNSFGQFVLTPAAPNSNALSTNGNVGIGTGTSLQSAKLHVLGTTNQFRLANGTYFTDINTTSSGHLVFQPGTAGTEVMFGTTTPIVGIGFHSNMGQFRVSDPASSVRGLHVVPNMTTFGDMPNGTMVTSIVSTSGEGLSFLPSIGTGVKMGAYALNNGIFSGGVYKSVWETENMSGGVNPNFIIVKNGGKVGIGTGAVVPDKLLTVKSTVGNTQIAKFADDMRYIGLGRDEVAAFDLSGNLANLYLGGAKLNILTNGNVGIGTTNPLKKLSVIGDANLVSETPGNILEILGNGQIPSRRGISIDNDPSGKFNFYVHGWQTNAGFYFKNSLDNSTALSIGVGGNTNIYASVNTNKYFVINDVSVPANPIETFAVSGNGYTKINVMNPIAMDNVIDVVDVSVTPSVQMFRVKTNGHVFAREVEIRNTSQSFPDYVFAKDYSLMPLSEVEKYIESNKHLPGFEKGTYYEENGIKSSEMFIKQQEKIEELTLYIIELEKRMKALETSSKH